MRTPDWQSPCGTVQMHCCDNMDLLPTIPKGTVDAVVTDPPYGIGFAEQPTKWQRRAGQEAEAWDDCAAECSWIEEMGVPSIVWGGNYFGFTPSRAWLVWHKPDAPPSMGTVELAWTNLDQCTRHITHSISATNAERVGHPTQKPLRVMQWTLGFLPDCKVVFDPFMGVATTGVACVRTGRRFIGCEIEPRYFEIAVKRIERALRDKAETFEIMRPEVKAIQGAMFE